MPVYNGERWLSEALESVLSQSLRDIEVIAVDDGSSDGSRAILERLASIDGRLTVVTNETNLGISAALNRGRRVARSPYIARLDADDVALPERLSRQAEFLDAHSSVAAVGGAAVLIDADGQRASTIHFPTSSAAIHANLLRRTCLAHPAVMLRGAALEEVGGYRLDHVEDLDLWLRLSERFELANLAEPVILYRQHPRQVSLTALEDQTARILVVRQAARARRSGHRDPLAGVDEVTPALLDQLGIEQRDVDKAVDSARLGWASTLAERGCLEEARQLVALTEPRLGRRAWKAFAAATELRRAETQFGAGRRLAAVAHAGLSFRHDPRYAWSRIRQWVGDRR